MVTSSLPKGFVYVRDIEPSIIEELRYFTNHNFLGRPVEGYRSGRAILTVEAAEALAKAQADFRVMDLSIKIYDAYRPQRAVNDFFAWSKDSSDHKMKQEFYPRIDKADVFDAGYVARKSGHSRGSTVDLTLVPFPPPAQQTYRDGDPLVDTIRPKGERFDDNSLEMGTGFDAFDEYAHTMNPVISAEAARNRDVLVRTLAKHGFENYRKEWWHYTLVNEPFPDTYFDFEVA